MNKVTLITAPDDILEDGIRILCVDLGPEQSQMISDALAGIENIPDIIVYLWKTGDDTDWLFDKKHKSMAVIFNADSENQLVTGYMAAQKNSYYFGTLKILQTINKSAIYTTDQCVGIFDSLIYHE